MNATKVVFRIDPEGDVLALFPEVRGARPHLCGSYAHVGQHGDADPEVVSRYTRPATPEEYADLKAELEKIGYTLEVI